MPIFDRSEYVQRLSICATILKLFTKISIRKGLTLSAFIDKLSLRCKV